jgi:NAD(P)-dependent dehydrogenase (short-subunit alcohol dehydrogenase family)
LSEEEKVAIVTGAARGIGRCLVGKLARSGFHVIAVDIDEAELGVAWRGRDDVTQKASDVSSFDAAVDVVGSVMADHARLDLLVNNAALHGPAYQQGPLEMSDTTWRHLMDVNVFGLLNMVRAGVDALAAAEGLVINVSSMSAYTFDPPSAYAVSKTTVSALTVALAAELGPRNIRVLGVAPGMTVSPEYAGPEYEEVRSYYLKGQAIKKAATPEDVADVVHLLAVSDSRLLVGHTIHADSGYHRAA